MDDNYFLNMNQLVNLDERKYELDKNLITKLKKQDNDEGDVLNFILNQKAGFLKKELQKLNKLSECRIKLSNNIIIGIQEAVLAYRNSLLQISFPTRFPTKYIDHRKIHLEKIIVKLESELIKERKDFWQDIFNLNKEIHKISKEYTEQSIRMKITLEDFI